MRKKPKFRVINAREDILEDFKKYLKENTAAILQDDIQGDNNLPPRFYEMDDAEGVAPKEDFGLIGEGARSVRLKSREEIHVQLLEFVRKSSESLEETIKHSEEEKTKWREKFMKTSIGLLAATTVFFLVLLVVGVVAEILFDKNILSNEILFGTIGVIVAKIVGILVLFVKFVNEVEHLKMFETIHKELLRYLALDKHNNIATTEICQESDESTDVK